MEVYPARKGASPGSAKLSDAHEEGSQVCERASERLFAKKQRTLQPGSRYSSRDVPYSVASFNHSDRAWILAVGVGVHIRW